ncbi:MAG: hypothetical protein LIO42_03460 [Oscillospiraceae bacterium]|nr:hypothetical protein [Oscillospiraceae bacterium]
MEKNIYFEQCMDFLSRMIEKYGDKVELPQADNPHLHSNEQDEKLKPVA